MSEINVKSWERPWSPKEMISNASNWSLAGDAGLLKYLEDFSEKMLAKVNDTNDRLNDLIDSTNDTSIALSNATNEFMGLRNTQFIESRVYEDDETLPRKPEPEIEQTPKLSEADRLDEMKKAILNGLEIVDKYYEKVEIPESDSDDDIDEPSIVYRPIDPYVDRPLPYVIGTPEWHKYWHVGLAHSSSSSETENDEEQFSESDIEALPQREQIPGISDTESDDIPKNIMTKPVANSTFNDNVNKNIFDSSSDSETGSLPPQVHTVNTNFAEELAAKLGKVESVIEPEVNKNPIKKPTNISAGIFSDEPPPLDEDDIFANKSMKSGLFSGGQGLFDDINDDTDFWNTKPASVNQITPVVETKPKPNIFDDNQKDVLNSKKDQDNLPTTSIAQQPKKPISLFDDEEDDLFSTPSFAQSKKTILAPFKTATPLFSKEPPELEPTNPTKDVIKKKPIGGVSILGPGNSLNEQLNKIIKNRAPSTSDSESEKETPSLVQSAEVLKTHTAQNPLESPQITPQKSIGQNKIDSIFDDNSPLFTDDIFDESPNKTTTSLFDSMLPEKPAPEQPKPKKTPNVIISEPSPVVPKPQSIFDDDDDIFSKPPSLPKSEKKPIQNIGLFDDDQDDIFNFNKSHSRATPSKSIDLFDPNPPELDESDAKSDLSLDNEPASFDTLNAGRISLFDNEPPLLSNESSGIVKDQSTRLESCDSSFLPTMSSSRRYSSDLFQENQSGDSLFTTKAKPSITDPLGKSDLSQISELDTPTKIDITPSGTESSLFDQSSIANQSDDTSSVKHKSLEPFGSFEQSFNETSDANESVNKTSEQPTVEQVVEPKKLSLFGEKDDVFKSPIIPAKPKPKITSLLADSDSDDDLFSKSSESKHSPHSDILNNTSAKPLTTKNIFEDDLFSGPNLIGVPDVDLFTKNNSTDTDFRVVEKTHIAKQDNINKKFDYEDNIKTADKTDPKKPLNISNKDNDDTDGQIRSSNTSPGKLKLNFNINVAALLPGASPPRRQNLEKSASFDSSENNQNVSPVENIRKSEELLSTPSIGFSEPKPDTILSSVAKERPRIQVKRRPSTRKARHEAIRKSAIDLVFDEPDITLEQNLNNTSDEQAKTSSKNILNIANNNLNSSEATVKSSDHKANPLSPSTDEEDLFSMPQESLDSQDDSPSLFEKESHTDNIERKHSKQNDIFASPVKPNSSIFSSSDSENDLFGSTESEFKKSELKAKEEELFKPIVAPAVVVPAKPNILEWDDNLFEGEVDIFSSKKLPVKSVVKKSLFEDDDEDDIFKEATSKPSSSKSRDAHSKTKKTTRVKKLTGDVVENIDDPLDALRK